MAREATRRIHENYSVVGTILAGGQFCGQIRVGYCEAKANVAKHKISFESAARVFDDPNVVLMKDRVDERVSSAGTRLASSRA
jgi:hypothetical protein